MTKFFRLSGKLKTTVSKEQKDEPPEKARKEDLAHKQDKKSKTTGDSGGNSKAKSKGKPFWKRTKNRVNETHIDASHFEIQRMAGKGGFGNVHSAKKKDTNELVALKFMSKVLILSKRGRFIALWNERNIIIQLITLQCPYLLVFDHVYATEQDIVYAMPFLRGGDLEFLLNHVLKRNLTEDEARFYAAEIVIGLESLHKNGFLYRDLKLQNIMLDKMGHIRLTDFSLIKHLREKHNFSTSGISGTDGYMAPEVIRDERYDYKVDYFAFGILLYTLLHKRRPWRNNADLLEKCSEHAAPQNKLQFSSKLSEDCVSFVKGLLDPAAETRLGYDREGGLEQLKKHPFLSPIDWDKAAAMELKPPITPPERANFHGLYDALELHKTKKKQALTEEQQALFEGIEFNNVVGESKQEALDKALSAVKLRKKWLNRIRKTVSKSGPIRPNEVPSFAQVVKDNSADSDDSEASHRYSRDSSEIQKEAEGDGETSRSRPASTGKVEATSKDVETKKRAGT